MKVRDLGLGVSEITPNRFGDTRGFFGETWQRQRFADAGFDIDWVQENQSFSAETYVLRGLHLQVSPMQQAKLVRVLKGSIFDVAVDVRPNSPNFGRWVSCVLSAGAFNQLFIPVGFAHGFLTLEPGVEVLYRVSATYSPQHERGIIWNDVDIAIDWPLPPFQQPLISEKDAAAQALVDFAASGEI